MWASLAIQIQETSQAIRQLVSFEKSVRIEERENPSLVLKPQCFSQVEKGKDMIEEMENSVHRHRDSLQTTLLQFRT